MKQSDIDYVAAHIGSAALLEQLVEESAELCHAAAKYARIVRGDNPTPVTLMEAHGMLCEEMADVLLVAQVLKAQGVDFGSASLGEVKLQRWMQRLKGGDARDG